MASPILQLLESKKVIVVLGSGGVGKTSSAIAMATAAARQGLKVGLLSIDPAKRLAQALGLALGSELKRIEFPIELGVKGELHACMLDQKTVFDQMVHKFSPHPKIAKRILADKLYIAASSNLSGSGEYMALAKLQELVEEGSYDLIVLDTPPDSNALDFLQKPSILAGFLEQGVMSWLVKPFHLASKLGMDKLFTVGERLMGGVAKITGLTALKTFAEFLVLMQSIIEGFQVAGDRVSKTLASGDTGFILICSPVVASQRSSHYLSSELQALGYKLNAIVFNRCLPSALKKSLMNGDDQEKISYLQNPILKHLLQSVEKENNAKIELFEDTKKRFPHLFYQEIDEQEYPIHNLSALYDFSTLFSGNR